ncbi:S1C family serine protease [Bacillus marinisedimentorum]|uniref:S1C family serine protease n=1 Tax=Bacillus marinisedimentorum TaxID=1821260 RepID=UPI000871B6BB|nr:S1C family serine protease [Bacillus marinisedimentorum]
MGYYDDEYENRRSKRRGGWFKGLFGVIIGALIVLFSLPFLLESGIVPGVSGQQDEPIVGSSEENGNDEMPSTTQNVNVDVNTAVTEAVDKVSEAVVGVVNLQQADFWSQQEGGETQEAGTGSGVIYKKENGEAFVVTNNHVVQGASQIEVSLADGTKVPAEMVGTDIFTDLAVLKMDAEHVEKVAEFGNSENLKPGEPALAIGNPLGLRFSGSVSKGIISGLERTIPVDLNGDGTQDWQAEVIQTDAAINPGNSGGALVNINGQVIGINSMKIAQSAVEGIGLAIPTSTVIPIIEQLEKNGEVKRPYMGVSIRSLSEVPKYHWQETLKLPEDIKSGVFVEGVVPMSPAGKAGLKELDVITALDGEPIENVLDLRQYLYQDKQIGEKLAITFYRNGKKQTTEMTLAEDQNRAQ